MLGRQQIAGIPTAISELFKNAHDAYARNAEVDFFRGENLLVLRDDGLGMSKYDFEQRWLTLGTDSKVGSKGLEKPPKDPDQDERPILGEKGIGRLAIAVLGPQVLIVSRAKRVGLLPISTVVAYINWGVFELPGLDLEEVVIPVREIEPGTMPDRGLIASMVEELLSSLDKFKYRIDPRALQSVIRQVKSFDVDPSLLSSELGQPSLCGDGFGTHFYITPTDDLIKDDIDNRSDERKATRFEKNLIGFTNTMTPGFKKPPILTKFRDYVDEGTPIERIGDKAFFSPQEFNEVDHHVIGTFDEFGQFQGNIGVYQKEPEPYVLNWDKADGTPTACGRFSLSFAYLQGAERDSLLSSEGYAKLKQKLDRHGGIYIYRDGVRVQPYGDSDYDFLDIERRRNLGASYYFYSYRRLFGVIELNGADNSRLTEKAGREGFRENKAYRDFRSILMNFFIQSAADFFREEGRYADQWQDTKMLLNTAANVRKKKSLQVGLKRNELRSELEAFFTKIEDNTPQRKLSEILRTTKTRIESVLGGEQSDGYKAASVVSIEKDALRAIDAERQSITISKPRGVGLPRALNNQWVGYLEQSERLNVEVFYRAEQEIESLISEVAESTKIPIDHISRLEFSIREKADLVIKGTRKLKVESEELASKVAVQIRSAAKDCFRSVNHAVDDAIAELANCQRVSTKDAEFSNIRRSIEARIEEVYIAETTKLIRLRDQLLTVYALQNSGSFDTAELAEALEEELDALQERRDADLELAQIGMALSTVTHEFEKTVGALRDGFRRLKAWAAENPALDKLYMDMRASFDHLDGYLTLFTPLDRRLYRKPVDITGKHIYDFLVNLFGERLQTNKIQLIATKSFIESSVQGFTSSFYPVFVNLVDNAIFWLQRINDRDREITLSNQQDGWVVSDNGPGIRLGDRVNIFSLNFSRRPGGRGMGLYISRQSMAKVGYELALVDSALGSSFIIKPVEESNAKDIN
ncbi:ATP-binding protein [Pseudomonas petrae]|uniref:ATP-binding protein n=1 Tax=Pseudomonas petrae TaxID=2912190 RepID=A0ABS9IE84_9PSED|nr:ATP-binding protein [Pseudomonas petrae]MCF7545729.1 ATP-binding protein [Pseudomonas petrae]